MLVYLENSIFDAADAFRAVELISIIRNTRHDLFADTDSTDYKEWAASVAVFAKHFEAILSATARRARVGYGTRKVHVHNANSDWTSRVPRLSIEDAKTYLTLPFKIFVENNNADRAFLLAYLQTQDREIIEELEQKGWLQFAHGGGTGDLGRQVVDEAKNTLRADLRVFAIFDNDALMRGSPSEKSTQLCEMCAQHAIEYYQLSRRTIENYVHHDALATWANSKAGRRAIYLRKALNTFKKLSDDEKDFFNMKAGMKGDRLQPKRQQYLNIAQNERRYLEFGFGKDLASVFSSPLFSKKPTASDYVRSEREMHALVQRLKASF